ncbi:efflux RND transporter periplasmic adaptor subunit [Thalassobacillus hwangdonensis]|uniref:Efflux RND transporter periplasmic adaptor subunit n=1 Tax=Thalassobacillus hwangdonensis TaxID=546108 RepID=A0ABW3L532_9BACI
MKKFKLLAAALIGTLIISGCSDKEENAEPENQITPVETALVTKGDLSIDRKVNGRAVAGTTSPVIPRQPGELVTLNVEKGDQVNEGDAIATVDPGNANSQVELQELAVQQAQQQLENAQIAKRQAEQGLASAQDQVQLAKDAQQASSTEMRRNIDAAQQQYAQVKEIADQSKELAEEGTIPEVIYEQAQAQADQAYAQYQQLKNQKPATSGNLQQAEAQVDQAREQVNQADVGIEQARLQVEQAQVQLNQAKSQASDNTITATASGEITRLNAREGDFVSNQQPIATIVSIDTMSIEATVTAGQLNLFEKSQEIEVRVDALDETVTANISYVSSVPNDTGLYPVEASITNVDKKIKPGMMATFLLPEIIVENTLIVPTEAVVEQSDGAYIYQVVDNVAKQISVTIVESQSDRTAIEAEIEKGAEIVTTGQLTLSDGADVSIIKEDA